MQLHGVRCLLSPMLGSFQQGKIFQEYLEKWNTIHQFFLKNPIIPENGYIYLPKENGLGMEYDEQKIESQKIL